MFFFFQAEDGIRAGHVTGVQMCALPIFCLFLPRPILRRSSMKQHLSERVLACLMAVALAHAILARADVGGAILGTVTDPKIGRASCREGVWVSAVGVSVKGRS